MGLILLIAVFVFFGVALILLVFVGMRNNLVRERNELGKAWTNVDQLLKQRRDELPRLIGTCRSYLTAETGIFDFIAAARAAEQKAPPAEKARVASELSQALHTPAKPGAPAGSPAAKDAVIPAKAGIP